MPFNQWLHADSVLLDYDTSKLYPDEEEPCSPRELRAKIHEGILQTITDLLTNSGNVINSSRLYSELEYNDHRVSGAIGENLAIPHARTLQARVLTLCFIRCLPPGVDYEAPDNEKVRIFIGMVGPSYDDRLYLQIYKKIAEGFLNPAYHTKKRLLSATTKGEIIRILDETCWYQKVPAYEDWDDNQDASNEEMEDGSTIRKK